MVNYYAYYSFGGYKEFYLGNTKDSFSHSWYFSMLPIWETRYSASGDEALKTKIEDAKSLPQIEDVGKGGDKAIPQEATTLITHGGYDVIYKTAGEYQVVAVKDIVSQDDTGRPAPFMMLFVARDEEGFALLDKLAEHLLVDLKAFKEKLSTLFVYDLDKNGLRFNVLQMNAILSEVNTLVPSPQTAWHKYYPVHLVITSQKLEIALQNQKVSRDDVFYARGFQGNVLWERNRVVVDKEEHGTTLEAHSEEKQDEGHSEKSEDESDCPVCIKPDTFSAKVKHFWNGLPNAVRYCIVAAVTALFILAICPRSCKKGDSTKSERISQVLTYEKTL